MRTPNDDPGCFPRPDLEGDFPKPEDGGCFPRKGSGPGIKLPLPGRSRSGGSAPRNPAKPRQPGSP
jgi:hypothetical protein